jgi:hypothetical protein
LRKGRDEKGGEGRNGEEGRERGWDGVEGIRFGLQNKFLDPPVLSMRLINITYLRKFCRKKQTASFIFTITQTKKYYRYFHNIAFQ